MKILLDTSVIVEIDRRNEAVIGLVKRLIKGNHSIIVSTITNSEILTGSYLMEDFKQAVSSAKRVLGQFVWINFDAEVAEKSAQYMAYLITEGKMIDYQDICIAATFRVKEADYLLTLNKKHFEQIPDIKAKVMSPEEFARVLK